jgi:hypothetical protein
MEFYTEGWNLTLQCPEKPFPISDVSMECWKYITYESFNGKNIPVARTSGDAAQKRDLWKAQLPLREARIITYPGQM